MDHFLLPAGLPLRRCLTPGRARVSMAGELKRVALGKLVAVRRTKRKNLRMLPANAAVLTTPTLSTAPSRK
jgi:hypothetical protein